MTDTSKIKYVSDFPVVDKEIKVRKPFKISEEDQRRFIRLEISAPLSLKNIWEYLKNNTHFEDLLEINGNILNISAGGVLIELEQPLTEDDIILMKFTLQDVETMSNVLGLVKRADHDDGLHLAGIEFLTMEKLRDRLSQAEYDLLADKTESFEEQVNKTLSKYLYHEA